MFWEETGRDPRGLVSVVSVRCRGSRGGTVSRKVNWYYALGKFLLCRHSTLGAMSLCQICVEKSPLCMDSMRVVHTVSASEGPVCTGVSFQVPEGVAGACRRWIVDRTQTLLPGTTSRFPGDTLTPERGPPATRVDSGRPSPSPSRRSPPSP